MVRVSSVLVEVERKIQPFDRVVLDAPRFGGRIPADPGVVGHPARQGLLAVGSERHARPAADPAELDAEQAAKCQAERRAVGIAAVADAGSQVLLAGSGADVTRGDPDVEKPECVEVVRWWRCEVPAVDSGFSRDWRRSLKHLSARPQPFRRPEGSKDRCGVAVVLGHETQCVARLARTGCRFPAT